MDGYDSFHGTMDPVSDAYFYKLTDTPPRNQFSLSKGFVSAAGARTLDTVATNTKIVSTYGNITAISDGIGMFNT